MKWLNALLVFLLILLQFRFWIGEGSSSHAVRLEKAIASQQQRNKGLEERNAAQIREIDSLRNGLAGVEEKARSELGLIKPGETFYLIMQDQ